MQIKNYKNTIICKRLIEELLKEYNFYALPHLNVKKPAKWNETNCRNLMSFIAKNENLDDAIKYIKENTYKDGKVNTLASITGGFALNGFKTYHGINLAKIIVGDFNECFKKYMKDAELEAYVDDAFSESGIAYQTGFSVPLPPMDDAKPEEVTPEDFVESGDSASDESNNNPDGLPAGTLPMEKITKELQKIASQTLAGYQLVLQQNAMDMLNQALENKKNEIIKQVEETMLANQLPATVININNVEVANIPGELHHQKYETVLKLVANKFNLYLYSEAGIGKTHLVSQVAKALNLPMYTMLPGNSIDLLGYEDAYGKFHETPFTKWAKNGGILYGSEFDANDASLILNLNTALANGFTTINGETIKLHKECRFIADGNSKLTGATSSYAGRQRQDSSIIDRLMFVEMNHDYKLELILSGNNKEWITFIKAFREARTAQGSNMTVSLRATELVLKAEKILPLKEALENGLLKGVNRQVVKAIADKLAIQLPNNKYAKALLEVK